jgi:hypothetical protein
MKNRMMAGLAGALVAGAVALAPAAAAGPTSAATIGGPAGPSQAVANMSNDDDQGRDCLADMRAAVEEDNAAFEARDADRYRAVLNPDLVVDRDGAVEYGRDAAMVKAIAFFQVPDWHWNTTILSATVYGCSTGVAIVDAHQLGPGAFDYHAHVAMTMTKHHGRWTVAMDYVHLIDKTPTS